jgi:hypothetical protein
MKSRLIAAVLVCWPWLAAGPLHGAEPAARYYPLKPGCTWTYKVSSNQGADRQIVITNLPSREMGGVTVTPRKWDMGGMVKYYFMTADSMGIYRYGEAQDEKAEPVPTKPKFYSLRDPMAVGTTWDISTKMGEDDLTVNLTVDSITETITVPAGKYSDCVKIKHQGGSPKGSVTLEAYEWYAPEVGLVKSIVTIKKPGANKAKAGEHLTYQLESFKK